jgi:DNA mismatch repair protein MutS2
MINASMLFNTKTFSPEFKLHIGRPGSSHALALAKKMRLPSAIISDTESMLNSDQLRLESMLSTLEEDQRQFYKDLETIKKDKQQAKQAKLELQKQRNELKIERKRIMHEAYTEAAAMVKTTKKQLQKSLKAAKTPNNYETSRQAIKEKASKIDKGLQATEAKPIAPIKASELKTGLTIWVEKLKSRATITSYTPGAKKVKIDLDGLPFEVPINQLGKIINPEKQPAQKQKIIRTSRPISQNTTAELNLLGQRVHPALHKLEKFIDQGMLANHSELRVIHGIGTGVLRAAIHEYLTRLNLDFRDGDHDKGEGGSGATIIKLAQH